MLRIVLEDDDPTIWLSHYILNCLVHCNPSVSRCSRWPQGSLPLWIASASLSGISMLNSYHAVNICTTHLVLLEHTSSIAMTTSTVSRLSSPKSFAKWDVGASLRRNQTSCTECYVEHEYTFDASVTLAGISHCLFNRNVTTYLVEVLQQIHYPALHLIF